MLCSGRFMIDAIPLCERHVVIIIIDGHRTPAAAKHTHSHVRRLKQLYVLLLILRRIHFVLCCFNSFRSSWVNFIFHFFCFILRNERYMYDEENTVYSCNTFAEHTFEIRIRKDEEKNGLPLLRLLFRSFLLFVWLFFFCNFFSWFLHIFFSLFLWKFFSLSTHSLSKHKLTCSCRRQRLLIVRRLLEYATKRTTCEEEKRLDVVAVIVVVIGVTATATSLFFLYSFSL